MAIKWVKLEWTEIYHVAILPVILEAWGGEGNAHLPKINIISVERK